MLRGSFKRVVALALLAGLPGLLQAQDVDIPAVDPYQQMRQLLEDQGIPFDREKASLAARDAALATIDRDARVLNPEQAAAVRAQRDGAFFGPGLKLEYKDGQAVIAGLRPDSPAAAKGVKIGDVLQTVNGSDITRQRFASLFALLRSPVSGPMKLGVKTPSNTLLDYELTPRAYRADAIELSETLPAHLGYLRVNGLYSGAAPTMMASLTTWNKQGCNGIILDLRDAGGADLQAAAQVAELFCAPDALLCTYRDHSGSKLREFHTGPSEGAVYVTVPMMVLVNQGTHGAAELLAAVLAVSGRGVMVVGETTSGNPEVREFIELPSGDAVWLAVKTLTLVDGSVYNGYRGLSPDVLVDDLNLSEGEVDALKKVEESASDDPAYLDSLRLKQRVQYDALLQRSVDILLGLKALNIHLIGR